MSNLWKPQNSNSSDLPAPDFPKVQETIDKAHRRRSHLLLVIFPDAQQRAIIENELGLIKIEFDARKRMLEVVRETQIQALQEKCNEFLFYGKAESRAKKAEFLLRKQQEVQSELNKIYKKFEESLEEQYTGLESITNERIRSMREEKIDMDTEQFFYLYKKLTDNFTNIVSEGV